MGPWHKKGSTIPLLKPTGYWLSLWLHTVGAQFPSPCLPPPPPTVLMLPVDSPSQVCDHNRFCSAVHQLTDNTVRTLPLSTANTKAHHWAQPRASSIECHVTTVYPLPHTRLTAHVSGSQVLKLYIGGAAGCSAISAQEIRAWETAKRPGQGSRRHSCKFCTYVRRKKHKEPNLTRTTVHVQRLLHSGGVAPLLLKRSALDKGDELHAPSPHPVPTVHQKSELQHAIAKNPPTIETKFSGR